MRGLTKSPDQVHLIEDAFADGMSLRAVIRKFRVGTQTAQSIRDGVHPLQNQDPSYHRCPGCGGKVILPCILCRVRKVMDDQRRRRLSLKDRRQVGDTGKWR